jgi:hypothetical protein
MIITIKRQIETSRTRYILDLVAICVLFFCTLYFTRPIITAYLHGITTADFTRAIYTFFTLVRITTVAVTAGLAGTTAIRT